MAPTLAPVLKKILIANRGEIAVRVIRAARELGIPTVAVYSELDRDALHVRLADEAYALGGQTAAESYLNTEAILDVIERSGADGVHPGYGFFSENADFARAITDHGRRVHRPAARGHRRDGRQGLEPRIAAIRGGAPIVPGTTEFAHRRRRDHGVRRRVRLAGRHQGRVRRRRPRHEGRRSAEAEVDDAMASAQREAKAFFGRDECYVERYLTWPRHVEMQIVGDKHGNCVWVGDARLLGPAPPPEAHRGGPGARPSRRRRGGDGRGRGQGRQGRRLLQRRHRRVPLPGRRVLLPRDEHPPPGRAPGHRDGHRHRPRRWQIRVAAGEPLPITQDEVDAARRGHAIEVRINAEDPAGGKFLPSPGTITKLVAPDGFGVRWDGGYEAGDEISQYYDNLVGKLDRVGHGPRRRPSPARIRALEETGVEGVATTIPADLAILRHPDFAAVDALDQVGRGDARPHRASAASRARRRPSRRRRRAAGASDRRRRGQRQALRRQACGCPRRRWWPSPPVRPPPRSRARVAAAAAAAAAPAAATVDGADAGHDREGARRGRPGRRGRRRPSSCSRR